MLIVDNITDKKAIVIIKVLVNLIEMLVEENTQLKEQVQRLKDEINRLKGEQGKPNIRGQSKGGDGDGDGDMKEKHQNLVKLGNKIRELRIARGYSQEGIADAAGMGRTYMGRVERGEQNISIQNLIQIAFALNVEVGELVPLLVNLDNPAVTLWRNS